MIRRLGLVLGLAASLIAHEARAVCVTLPYTLTNGTLADAAQVMANFNALATCVNAPLTIFGTVAAHYVLAGPTSGGAINPAFRQLSTADLSDIATFSLNTSGTIKTTNATASTTSSTGALVVTGGLGVGGAANIQGAVGIGGNLNVSGVSTLTAPITVTGNTVSPPLLGNIPVIYAVGGNDGRNAVASVDAGNHAGTFLGASSGGTLSSPSASQINDGLATYGSAGYGATQYVLGSGGMVVHAAENWTDTKNGTYINFDTVAPAATVPALRRLRILTGLLVQDGSGNDPTSADKGAGTVNVATGYFVNGAGIASCSVLTAGATITITGGIVTAFTGC